MGEVTLLSGGLSVVTMTSACDCSRLLELDHILDIQAINHATISFLMDLKKVVSHVFRIQMLDVDEHQSLALGR